jgi:transcriptional regulator with XRE-family HTH domain
VLSASLLVQARRSAGFSQRELAARAGVAQQEIARYERGHVTPSLERLRALIAACGLELTVGVARADNSYDEQITAALALTPAERLQRALRDAQPLRSARAERSRTPAPAPADVLGVLRALQRADVQYVLSGELAEVVHGSPLLPVTGSVTIVPRVGQRERLNAALAAAGGAPIAAPATSAIDAAARFALDAHNTELVIEPAPAATQGYDDLRRDAAAIQLDEDLDVAVASLVDLVRIADASEDKARVPALRRTLELTTAPSAARAA